MTIATNAAPAIPHGSLPAGARDALGVGQAAQHPVYPVAAGSLWSSGRWRWASPTAWSRRRDWAHMTAASRARFDPANISLAGLAFAPLAIGVAGVLVMSGEYGSGLIRSTLAAVPRRRLLLAAKAAVLAARHAGCRRGHGVRRLPGRAGGAGRAGHLMPPWPSPGYCGRSPCPGAYLALLALFGLGLGAIIRRSAGAIAAYAGLVLVLSYALLALPGNLARFAPETMLASSVAAVRPQPHYLPPGWAGVAVMALYTAVTLVAGGWLLGRRDA